MEPFSPSASSTKPTQPTSHKKSAKGGPSPLQIHDRDTEQGTPENQLSPTFNTETSTTDSGVSNASSLTSDCPTGTHCLGLDMCNTEDATITGWFKEGCPDRNDSKREDGCPSKCVGNMTGTDSSLHSTNSGPTTGDHPGNSVDEQITTLSSPTSHTHHTGGTLSETSGSRCSSSLDCLEPPPPSSSSTHHPDLSPQEIQKKLLEGMQMLSTADGSHETEGTDSLVLPSQRPRQRSESPVPTRPRTSSLRFVFKRWVMFGDSIILFWFVLSTSRWAIIKEIFGRC